MPPAPPPRIVLNARPGVDWNTCGQAAIATMLAHFRLGPFAVEARLADGEAIDRLRRGFGPDMPLALGTTAFRIAAALRAHGLGVERIDSGLGVCGDDACTRLRAHVATGTPVPACVESRRLGGRTGFHWVIVLEADDSGVRLGNGLGRDHLAWPEFMDAWACRALPPTHHHAALLAWV
jgi:hypothetical protein